MDHADKLEIREEMTGVYSGTCNKCGQVVTVKRSPEEVERDKQHDCAGARPAVEARKLYFTCT